MAEGRFLTISEQVAGHLRDELARGRWSGTLPGLRRLAAELEVNSKTVEVALQLLEQEGVLVGQGARRARRIVSPEKFSPPVLRVAMLLYEEADAKLQIMLNLHHQLIEAGHTASFASRSLVDLGMDLKRIARFVKRTEADAWVVVAGSLKVLQWFAEQRVPAIALAGRQRGVPIAGTGPDKLPIIRTLVRRLVDLGHRRIVMLARSERRKPGPGSFERAFLGELEAHGIATGSYNLPDWDNTRESFHRCLDSLFEATPPTALFVPEAQFLAPTQQHLARQGIVAPEHISLVCDDSDPSFTWCEPSIAHISWDSRPVVRRIVRWTNNVAHGKDDRRKIFFKAEFVEGGTVGQVPGKR